MGVTTENVRASAVTASEVTGGRDADLVDPSQFPIRILPVKVSGRSARYQVVFDQDTVDAIRAHGEGSPEAEVCGVLVGNIYRDSSGPYCYVKANIRGNHAPARNSQVTFTSETWTEIHEQMDARYPHDRIVGWYHTHPGFGIFLSEMDLFIQENFFNEAWQIAYVDDPLGGDRGVFVWENGAAVRRDHLLESKSMTPASDSATESNAGLESATTSNSGIGPERRRQKMGDLLETSARLHALEREVIAQRRRSRWSMIVALVWPLILLAGLAWTGAIQVEKVRNSVPVKWSVARWAQISAAVRAGR